MTYGPPPSAWTVTPDASCCPATFDLGLAEARRQDRIAAFGAIRRAAEVMRWHENNAKRLASERPDGLNEYEAKAIRRAIRAAIGSEKA